MAQKILLVNKFYYPRGGDCVVMMNTESLLLSAGHDVAVYAMQYPETVDSPYKKYFAPEVSFAGGVKAKIQGLKRTLGLGDITASFERLLDDFQPQVVHLHNIHSYLSPVLAKIAKQRGCRVVWTMHDYKLLCPAYSCTRGGHPCELCYSGKGGVLKHRCMKGSLAASAIAWLEAKKWNRKVLEQYTDAFICPSAFMAQKMKQGGFSPEKVKVLCNFVDPKKLALLRDTDGTQRGDYYCYVGRLSEEKGVRTLLEAAAQSGHELRIAGGGPLEDELKAKYAHCSHIKFLGHLDAQGVTSLLSQAKCSVMPSECYENNPLGVIESLCAGTPVVGARIGGIPELIDAETGITFPSGDAQALAAGIHEAMGRQWQHAAIKAAAINRFSPESHQSLLENIYKA
ncbi:MAG: glycosyltransferase [Bacteroidales bacterium]|nr:glycosyltransferase [Bacteroidales bacterium]